ncbi:MAG: 2-polyprenylphenol hydroxylase [Devosia sp.]|nr:2-polyprenylphenol hydroxylase [Devosia sp.]
MGLGAYFRLVRAGWVLAREGAFSLVDPVPLPAMLRFGLGAARLVERRSVRRDGPADRLTRALNTLGPTYVKFGQTLATRPDIVGPVMAAHLASLHDAMPPFDGALVPAMLREALGERAATLTELSAPIAAASIAQVHRAIVVTPQGKKHVAVKLLRPGVAERFRADLASYRSAAELGETLFPKLRRLRPVGMVAALEQSARLELDLRLEAASISELTQNIAKDTGFRAPTVDWDHTAHSVLTTEWIDGIPLYDHAALDAAGLDRKALAVTLLRSFLRHSIRDGFFHADMHPGNLFADPKTGDIVAVDFGIMGRINRQERRVFADILYGFITRDYRLIAERHFEIGYVPAHHSVDDFALALRSIGEPLHGRRASDISMAKVLGQLFAITEMFDMAARPELLLLQKNMVLVEGVARALDPDLDMWTAAEPVVGDWVRREAGPLGRLTDVAENLKTVSATLQRLPGIVSMAESALRDYHAERTRRTGQGLRWLIGIAFTLFAMVSLVLIWRLLFPL